MDEGETMRRRDFLKAAVAAALGPVTAPLAAINPPGGGITVTFRTGVAILNPEWVCFIHPCLVDDLRSTPGLGSSMEPLFHGEVGRVDGVSFIEREP